MSVKETNKIDGMGIEENTNFLVFLIADPYAWELDEYDHLKTMQTKINNYVGYIENKGYLSVYPDRHFDGFRIEAALKYPPTKAGVSFFEAGKQQLKDRNIDFTYTVIEKKEK